MGSTKMCVGISSSWTGKWAVREKEKRPGQYGTEFLIFPLEKFGFDVPQF
jgi:hypothetical protein